MFTGCPRQALGRGAPVVSAADPDAMPPTRDTTREVLRQADVCLVRWHGRISGHTPFLDRTVFTGWLNAGDRRFVFNLSEVTRMDSFAIGVLVACARQGRSQEAIIKLVLSRLQIELFELLHLGNMFQLYEREDDAMNDFERPRGLTEVIR